MISFVVIAFAWTWAYVILFLIVFPIPDNPVRTLPGDLGPTIGALVMTAVLAGRAGVVRLLKQLVATRGRLGYSGAKMPPSVAPAYSTP